MSRRPLLLAALTVAISSLAARDEASSLAQPSSQPALRADRELARPACRDGGWSSSTGRCG